MPKMAHKIAIETVHQATDALVVTLDDEGSVTEEKLVQVIAKLQNYKIAKLQKSKIAK